MKSPAVIIHRVPRSWIKGDGYPNGIDRNDELSERDKKHVRKLYSSPKGGPRTPRPREHIQVSSGTNPIHPNYPWYNYYIYLL